MIKNKELKIWLCLLEYPDTWNDVAHIAHDSDLTYRQVITIIGKRHPELIQKRKDNRITQVKFAGDREMAEKVRRELYAEYYHVSKEEQVLVRNTLSFAGWMTTNDIESETGLKSQHINHILSTMEGICSTYNGSSMMYRREPDV